MQEKFNTLFTTTSATQPTTCLGITFADENERRSYFEEKLREQLENEDFQKIPGFPQATSATILSLSDPPYYTLCPNPWLTDWLREWATSNQSIYHREPFSADISEGKNNPIYTAHPYHTKVPHKAIMRYILHYTAPGDVIFDGFGGTGMTGVAAQLCGDQRAVEELGYRVQPDSTIEAPLETAPGSWQKFSQLGVRRAILNDLSPTASFIAYNYNIPLRDADQFEQELESILQRVEVECSWLYQTIHACASSIQERAEEIHAVMMGEKPCPSWLTLGRINHLVWSDIFLCPQCAHEIIFWKVAVDQTAGKVKEQFACPHCDARLNKRQLDRAWVTQLDRAIAQTVRQPKQVIVLINYSVGKKRFDKHPDNFDLALLERIEQGEIPYWYPTTALPKGDKTAEPLRLGITHVHHFYTKRNLWIFATFIHWSQQSKWRNYLLCLARDCQSYATKMVKLNVHRLLQGGGQFMGLVSGTFYLPSLHAEQSALNSLHSKAKKWFKWYQGYPQQPSVLIECCDSRQLTLPDACIDYIFLDPPFGANIMYSELNFLWEAWLKVFTEQQGEAIINKAQGKSLDNYRWFMLGCFKEAFRILKPGHWMTVEFSNTQAQVWNTIQTALQEAGFIIAHIAALDKQQGSFNAVTTTISVKQDLIISAYKPQQEQQVTKVIADETNVWEFVRHHLNYLPIPKNHAGELSFIAEREPRILYDHTVAYFLRQGYPIPLSSLQFQAGLRQHFQERDDMIFLAEQLEEYERRRQLAKRLPQIELFILDERSAVDWLHRFLSKHPATYQEIHPEFMKQLGITRKKHETIPELDILLELNFLKYTGTDAIPSQIIHHLTHQDGASLDESFLQQHALERWYVPDPQQAQDLEKLRENHFLREFKQYCQSGKKTLKIFRLEVLRAGFKKAWEQKDYQTIINVAQRIPEAVLYADEKLLALYDLAKTRC
jgi:DNA modification methylase